MQSKRTLIKNEETNENSTKTTLEYFRFMGENIRFEIGKYLEEKDHKNLKAVSRDLHGPIHKIKYNCKEEGKVAAKKITNKLKQPIMYLNDKLEKIVEKQPIALIPILTVLNLPILTLGLGTLGAMGPSSSIAFFTGAAKAKIENERINNNYKNGKIRPFEGEPIRFKKP